MAELWPIRRANLNDLLHQNYSEQFHEPTAAPPPTDPPAAAPNPNGVVGQERPHLPGQPPVMWHEEEEEDQHQAIRPPRQPHEHLVEEEPPAAAQENRRMCCCFCFGTAARRAERLHLPPPDKDAEGPWSTHHSVVNGAAVCAALRRVVCGWCGATGDFAHTTRWHELNLPIPFQPFFN